MTRALVAFALLCASCSCSSDETLGSIDEPLHAEVVWRKTTSVEWKGSGHYVVAPTGLQTTHRGILIVKDHDERPLPDNGWDKNTKVELHADEKGERIAYRKPPEPWRVAYVVSKEHVFLDSNTVTDADFAKHPRFADVAIQLFSASELNKQTCVVEEVEKAGGSAAVASLLAGTVDVRSDLEWDSAFGKLPAEHKRTVLAELEKKVLAGSTGLSLDRALAKLDVSQPRFAAVMLATAKKLAAEATKKGANPDRTTRNAGMCLRAAAVAEPAKASSLACELLAFPVADILTLSAVSVLAKSRASCAAATKLLEKQLCGDAVACLVDPGASDFCPTDGPRAKLENALKASYRELPFDADAGFAMWAASLPELPEPIALLKKRTSYVVSGAGRECPAAKEGEACRPNPRSIHKSLCQLSGDTGETVAARYRVDDSQKRIVNVTSAFGADYQALVTSEYLGMKLRGCALRKDGSVACFELAARETREPGRPVTVAGLSKVVELEAADRRVCARSDRVTCFDFGAELDKVSLENVELGEPVKDIAVAGLAVCGVGASSGELLCQRGKHAPAAVSNVEGVTRLVSTTDAFGLERAGKSPMFVRCDGNDCRATEVPEASSVWVTSGFGYIIDSKGDVSRWKVPEPAGKRELVPLKNVQQARELNVRHEAGCVIDRAGQTWCFGETGVAERGLDRVKSVSLARHPVTHDRTVLALRGDGSVWTWSLREPKPLPLW